MELSKGALSQGTTHLIEAIEVACASECFESLARGLVVLARTNRISGDPGGALTYANETIEIAQRISAPTCEMWGEMEAALALLALGKPTEALVRSVHAQTLLSQALEGWIAKLEVHEAHLLILKSLGNVNQ